MGRSYGFVCIGFAGLLALCASFVQCGRHGHVRSEAPVAHLSEMCPNTAWRAVPPSRLCIHGHTLGCALFAPGTPQEYMDEINRAIAEAVGPTERFNAQGSQWSFSPGSSGALTYSFPPDGLLVPAAFSGDTAGANNIHQRLDALFGSQGGRAAWKQIFRDNFDRWSEITGIQYTEVSDNGAAWNSTNYSMHGQIRIVMRPMDGLSGVLAFNYYPDAPGGTRGNMILDSAENWGNNWLNHRFLRNTIAHEHGHGLGLAHICPTNDQKLMEPMLSFAYEGPQLDDIRGVQHIYGDRYEPNGTADTAALLGVISYGQEKVVEEVSIASLSDIDFYRFTVPPESRLTITVEPVGTTYQQSLPNTGGSCPETGTPFSALTIGDLQFSLRNSNGLVVYAAVTETGFGEPEVLENFEVPYAGTYHIRVSAAAMNGAVQMYRLRVQVNGPPGSLCLGDLNGDGVVNALDLGTLLSHWGSSNPVADLNGDGVVSALDLAMLLSQWGPCQ